MWVRKNAKEIAEDRCNIWLAFGGPALACAIAFVLTVVGTLAGPKPSHQVVCWPTNWYQTIRVAAKVSILATIVAYVCQVLFGKPIMSLLFSSNVCVCNKCYRVKSPDGQQSCACGGRFEDFELWKWVDD